MKINPRTPEAMKLFMEGTMAFSRAELAGIRVDVDYIISEIEVLKQQMQDLEDEFKETTFFKHWEHSTSKKININSKYQLSTFLYSVKKLEPPKLTDTGNGSTDKEALQQLNIPALNLLIRRSKIKKAVDVLEGFYEEQVNGYIHTSFNLNMVVTYRSSSNSPNMQNTPKRGEEMMKICRKAIIPRPGHQLIEIDLSGAEIRIAACYNKDEKFIYDIVHGDMHSDMTKQIFLMENFNKSIPSHNLLRAATKNGFVFPQFYGDYYKNCSVNLACKWGELPQGKWKRGQGIEIDSPAFTLSDHLISKGLNSFDKFEEHIKKIEKDFWENRYSVYNEWKELWWKLYLKYGYVDLLTGFRCKDIMRKNVCINTPIQGVAFHYLLKAFIMMDALIISKRLDSKLVSQVHDSLIIDCHPDETEYVIERVMDIIENKIPKLWKWVNVPIEADVEKCLINGSWAEKEKY